VIPPKPKNEKRRLEVLWQYELLDTVPEQAFDDLTLLAARLCEAPIATLSLVDENRQWFKSKVGLSVSETSRDISFCAHAILQSGLFIIPDATKDPRFRDNPLVTSEPKIRFYAGAPLITPDGHALGTLCVIDKVPRELRDDQKDGLRALARHVVMLLELRRRTLDQQRAAPPAPREDSELRLARREIAALRAELDRLRKRRAPARPAARRKVSRRAR
jgi:GAF domain-containing protein